MKDDLYFNEAIWTSSLTRTLLIEDREKFTATSTNVRISAKPGNYNTTIIAISRKSERNCPIEAVEVPYKYGNHCQPKTLRELRTELKPQSNLYAISGPFNGCSLLIGVGYRSAWMYHDNCAKYNVLEKLKHILTDNPGVHTLYRVDSGGMPEIDKQLALYQDDRILKDVPLTRYYYPDVSLISEINWANNTLRRLAPQYGYKYPPDAGSTNILALIYMFLKYSINIQAWELAICPVTMSSKMSGKDDPLRGLMFCESVRIKKEYIYNRRIRMPYGSVTNFSENWQQLFSYNQTHCKQ